MDEERVPKEEVNGDGAEKKETTAGMWRANSGWKPVAAAFGKIQKFLLVARRVSSPFFSFSGKDNLHLLFAGTQCED